MCVHRLAVEHVDMMLHDGDDLRGCGFQGRSRSARGIALVQFQRGAVSRLLLFPI